MKESTVVGQQNSRTREQEIKHFESQKENPHNSSMSGNQKGTEMNGYITRERGREGVREGMWERESSDKIVPPLPCRHCFLPP